MIEAGSIGIKAVWVDAEARQSADRFYADMKRKRDEAMSGGPGGQGPAAGRVDPGSWRNSIGAGGGNNIWINPGAWRGGMPAVGGFGGGGGFPNWMQGGGAGGGGGGGQGGGGIPPWLLGWRSQLPQQAPPQQQGFPSWMMGMQSPINQPQQIPPWLWGWRSPINPAAGQPSQPAARSFFNIRPMAAAYIAIHGASALAGEYYRGQDEEYARRTHGAIAGLEADYSENQRNLGDPLGRLVRSGLSKIGIGESDEAKREAIDRARSAVKDVQAGRERASAGREAGSEVSRFEQSAELSFIRDRNQRRLAESKNAYDNLRMQLDNRLAAARDEAAINDDPLAQTRLDAGVRAMERNNAIVLSTAQRARGAEAAGINRDAIINRHEVKSSLEAAKLDYGDRPRAADAQRLFGKIQTEFESDADKENAADMLRIGRFELMNIQKESLRRGFAQEFDPRGAAFGVRQTGKEDTGELSNKIGQLIKTIETWMPGLK